MKRVVKKVGSKSIYINPTDEDLLIPGEFLGIRVLHSSFVVEYQMVIPHINVPEQHDVYQKVFPLSELRRFFKYNSEATSFSCCHRPYQEADWALKYQPVNDQEKASA